MSSPPHFLAPLLEPDAGDYGLRNSRGGQIVARRIELAGDSRTRRRGLLGRTSLDPDTAMIIAPCNGVHTFFMRFTIDVAFVDRQGQVLKVYRRLKPWRIGLRTSAFAAVELAEDGLRRSGVEPGDRLVLVTALDCPPNALSRAPR